MGKTFALLTEPLYYYTNPRFGGVYFRRTTPEITAEGALWDEANLLYGTTVGGYPLKNSLTWHFPGRRGSRFGAKIKFNHLEREDDKYKHKGAQYNYIAFDELTSFTDSQFWYLLSRNRSMSGVPPFVRATTNPQTEGWVKDLISWWLYPDDYYHETDAGYPIPERNGRPRFLFKQGSTLIWGDTRDDVVQQAEPLIDIPPERILNLVKSFTFIGGSIFDNKKLLETNPQYLGNLNALPEEERLMQLKGCWKFQGSDFDLFAYNSVYDLFSNDFVPGGSRYLTADIAHQGADRFVIMVWDGFRVIHILEMEKADPVQVEHTIKNVASQWSVPRSNIAYDATGVGNYLRGYLRNAISFVGSSAPLPFRGEKRPNYLNMRAQCYWLLSEYIQNAKIYIESATSEQRDRISKELRATKRKPLGSQGTKLAIVPKLEIAAKLGFSPDYADCLSMRMRFELRGSTKTITRTA